MTLIGRAVGRSSIRIELVLPETGQIAAGREFGVPLRQAPLPINLDDVGLVRLALAQDGIGIAGIETKILPRMNAD
jgi:hypothetical protein